MIVSVARGLESWCLATLVYQVRWREREGRRGVPLRLSGLVQFNHLCRGNKTGLSWKTSEHSSAFEDS